MSKNTEILAPAGSFASLKASFKAGADAVYAGGSRFGARAYAGNFDSEEMLRAIDYAHIRDKKLYLTLNTLVKEQELEASVDFLRPFYEQGLDAVIVQDLGILAMVEKYYPKLPIHLSTQMNVTDAAAAELFMHRISSPTFDEEMTKSCSSSPAFDEEIIMRRNSNLSFGEEIIVRHKSSPAFEGEIEKGLGGFSGMNPGLSQITRIVPARELTIEEIRRLKQGSGLEIEVFVHGALCYCYSGQCLFSSMKGDRSGNRGHCAQICRKKFSFDGREGYLLSPKDICTIDNIPELIEAGVDSFKIEGRMKSPEYAAGVSKAYADAVRLYEELGREGYHEYFREHSVEREKIRISLMDLFNRGGFSDGYAFTEPGKGMMALERPNHNGVFVGKAVIKNGMAYLMPETALYPGDVLEIRDESRSDWYSYTLPTGSNTILPGEKTISFRACPAGKDDAIFYKESGLKDLKNQKGSRGPYDNKKAVCDHRRNATAKSKFSNLSVPQGTSGRGMKKEKPGRINNIAGNWTENFEVSVYRIRCESLLEKLKRNYVEAQDSIPVCGKITAHIGEPLKLTVWLNMGKDSVLCHVETVGEKWCPVETTGEKRCPVEIEGEKWCPVETEGEIVEAAKSAPTTESDIRSKILRSGDSEFVFEKLDSEIEEGVFIPKSRLGEIRRNALEALEAKILQNNRRNSEFIGKQSAQKNSEKKETETVRINSERTETKTVQINSEEKETETVRKSSERAETEKINKGENNETSGTTAEKIHIVVANEEQFRTVLESGLADAIVFDETLFNKDGILKLVKEAREIGRKEAGEEKEKAVGEEASKATKEIGLYLKRHQIAGRDGSCFTMSEIAENFDGVYVNNLAHLYEAEACLNRRFDKNRNIEKASETSAGEVGNADINLESSAPIAGFSKSSSDRRFTIITDENLYVANHLAAQLLTECGADAVTLSHELDRDELQNLVAKLSESVASKAGAFDELGITSKGCSFNELGITSKGRSFNEPNYTVYDEKNQGKASEAKPGQSISTVFDLYGREQLMISRQCIKKSLGRCEGKSGWSFIKDEEGRSYPVHFDCGRCINRIFDSRATDLISLLTEIRELHPAVFRLSFTCENETQCREILKKLKEGHNIKKKEAAGNEFRGHYYSGVK